MDGEDPGRLEQQADRCAESGDYETALAWRERAFAGWRAAGEVRRAARLAAYQIAFDHLALFGNRAVAQGWIERAAHLVEQEGECAEAGWVALSRALQTADPSLRAGFVDEASRLAERHGDDDLAFDALAYAGLAMVEDGRVSDGMRRLDEAAAAARGGEVASPVVAGEIFCKLLVACEGTLDVRRAEEWEPVTTSLGEQPAVAWASAICRTHHGGILMMAGRWAEAEHELEESLRLYDATYRALRSAALVRLAELRVRQGRLSECRELLAGQASEHYAVRPWARSEWLRAGGRAERCVVTARLKRALDRKPPTLLDVPALALLTDMQLACGEVSAAIESTRAMTELTAPDPVDALVGYARCGQASVLAADTGSASGSEVVEVLEMAIAGFTEARLPLEAAGARLRLAELVHVDDPELARAEARVAAESFAWLGARTEHDQAAALLRRLGSPGRIGARRPGTLTNRETEVLALVSQGLNNPQIAERLCISRKTASHHVSNVLTKLDAQNRAEAAAWAAAHGLTGAR